MKILNNTDASTNFYDVIVAGGGPAGCCAAAAAARAGMKTLIIEASTALGGMSTMGMVSAIAPFTNGEKLIYGSLPIEIISRYKSRLNIPEWKWDWLHVSPEDLKAVYDETVSSSGADILFRSLVCAAETENGKITSISVANKSGITLYRAMVYIDCTGDGDLAYFSGVPFDVGDDGKVQPASMCFAISNVDTDMLNVKLNSNFDDSIWPKIIADGKYPLISRHFIYVLMGNTLIVNGGHIYNINPLNPAQVSNAYIIGRKTAEQYHAALKEYLPDAFSDSLLVETAPILGVRESRRIKGVYSITLDDYLNRRTFNDEIARNSYWLDCHPSEKNGKSFKIENDLRYKKGDSHGIPYRCLLPLEIDNLLVAGRCISVERTVLASTRVMPNCMATGEAAGIAAAISVKEKINVKSINGARIKALLKKQQ